MNTYCEKKGHDYIDWNARLARAHEASIEELEQWVTDSESWVTCACGNQCKDIPRDKGGAPEDQNLQLYGIQFMTTLAALTQNATTIDHIKKHLIESAKLTLELIEQRSAEILAEMAGGTA